ncbi:MAG: 1-aminocyclopropane-1-carboxylate deaminase [Bacteroidetes bacterium HGW-Bacteroidetes-12]|nr:MAG: 1-aminocyclopropane-1-carboxylate deaminase [Bacteroidetes bacterium HGW-Bacteroidetes-12]
MQHQQLPPIPLQQVKLDFLEEKNIELYVLREDLIHPTISGNKWRKLFYNLQEAKNQGKSQIVTFGGAFSNHIAATAAAGNQFGFKTIGIIRGEEHLPLNPTLQLALENGMRFHYVDRTFYREKKYDVLFLETLKEQYGDFYLVPEGGSNAFAVKGCTEILKNINIDYDIICCACGTGGTIAGIIAAADETKNIIGFPALKGGEFLKNDIQQLLADYQQQFLVEINHPNWSLNTDYHFGGYAKINNELVEFVNDFYQTHTIPLDLIYTGKMLFGILHLAKTTTFFNGKKIVAVHTGGLQGNKGFNNWEVIY